MTDYPKPLIVGLLGTAVSVGPNVNAETVLFSTLVPGGFITPGCTLHLELDGHITTVGGTPMVDIRVRFGPVTLTGVQAIGADHNVGGGVFAAWRIPCGNNQTTKGWGARGQITRDAAGPATLMGQGMLWNTISTTAVDRIEGSDQISTVGGMNFAVDNLLEVTADWDNLAANVFTLTNGCVTLQQPAQ